MPIRTLCATRPRRASLPIPGESAFASPSQSRPPSPGGRGASLQPAPSPGTGAPTTRHPAALPCPALRGRRLLPAPAETACAPPGRMGLPPEPANFASIYWLPLSLLTCSVAWGSLAGGWAVCLRGGSCLRDSLLSLVPGALAEAVCLLRARLPALPGEPPSTCEVICPLPPSRAPAGGGRRGEAESCPAAAGIRWDAVQ